MSEPLSPDLERRIEALEHLREARNLEPASWGWLILFGVVLPALLLIIGCWS